MSVCLFKSWFLVIKLHFYQQKPTFEQSHQHISNSYHLIFQVNLKFCNKIFFVTLYLSAPAQKFGRKMKNFKIFFDSIDNHTCVHMLIKKILKILRFLAKFLNFLKNGPSKYFQNWSDISFCAKFSFGIGGTYSTFFSIEVLSWWGVN